MTLNLKNMAFGAFQIKGDISINIRLATVEDEEFVNHVTRISMAAAVSEMWPDRKDQETYYELNQFQNHDGPTWIIEAGKGDGRRSVGRLSMKKVEDDEGGEGIDVAECHVLPEYQSCGIFTRILNHLNKFADSHKCFMQLIVLQTNSSAQKLYERLGFEVTGQGTGKYAGRNQMRRGPR